MLCERCRAISLPLISHPHSESLDVLKASANDGCHFCSLLWQAASQKMGKKEFPKGWHALACSPGREHPVQIRMEMFDWSKIFVECVDPNLRSSIPRSLGFIALYPKPGSGSGVLSTGCQGRQVLQSADSQEAFDLIRSWSNNCLKHHGCKKVASKIRSPTGSPKARHPTRLIDVGDGLTDPRLIETNRGLNLRYKYTALSHCWGKTRPATTTTSTLPERLKIIQFSTLPKTFQDAIRLTRVLGIRYLWIDSLCILQDSVEDWRRESGMMGQIYTWSFMAICAAGADDSHQGCFVPRPPPKIGPCDLGFGVYAAEFIEAIPLFSPEAVDSRAWCLQEVALAPRVLMCGTRMMSWLCDGGVETEQGKMSYSSARYGPRFRSNHWSWESIVSNYTRRSLSEEKDKLVAISGLARRLEEKSKGLYSPFRSRGKYMAGLWRNSLLTDLLWRVDVRSVENSSLVRRPTSYRSPSWSWACLDGPITCYFPWKYDQYDIKADIIEANVKNATGDEYGEVIDARLRIVGPCTEIRCRNTTSSVYPACFPLSSGAQRGSSASRCASCWFDVRHERDWSATTLLCLVITGSYGLLLLPADNHYLRVGIATWADAWDLESPRREVLIL